MNDWSRKELCVFVEVWRENKEDKNYEQMGSTWKLVMKEMFSLNSDWLLKFSTMVIYSF